MNTNRIYLTYQNETILFQSNKYQANIKDFSNSPIFPHYSYFIDMLKNFYRLFFHVHAYISTYYAV